MRVGIPLFGDEIAPRFGAAQEFLVAEVEHDRAVVRKTVVVTESDANQLPAAFERLGINVLVCCGITMFCEQSLREHHVDVISGVMGPAEQALNCFINGTLRSGQILSRSRDDQSRGRGRKRQERT